MSVSIPPQSRTLKTTKASSTAVLTGQYGSPYTIIENELLRPLNDEALVRLDYTGICHGDVYSRDGGGPAPSSPIRPLTGGHEGVGEIVSFAFSKHTVQGYSIGDKVGIAWRSQTCGECEACCSHAENHCPQQEVVGMHRNGTFQQYITFPIRGLIRLPKNLDPALACPILCAGVTAYVAIRKMHPQKGKWCVISGAGGGLGHLAIQYAKKVFGLRVLAIDGGSREKADFCRAMGCDEYVDFVKEGANMSAEVKRRTEGGADYILLLSPHQGAYTAAGEYARFRAHLMAVGIGNCSMPLRPILKKDLTVRSSETGTKDDIEEALLLSAQGTISGKIQKIGLYELNHALDRVKTGNVLGKIVIDLQPANKTGLSSSTQLHALLA